jgi:hypothetical protein
LVPIGAVALPVFPTDVDPPGCGSASIQKRELPKALREKKKKKRKGKEGEKIR